MTATRVIDPEAIGADQIRESEGGMEWWPSPFTVPRSVTVVEDGGLISRLTFEYAADKLKPNPGQIELLDPTDKSVSVALTADGRLVRELRFDPPCSATQLPTLGDRLAASARIHKLVSRRINLRLLANLLQAFHRQTGRDSHATRE